HKQSKNKNEKEIHQYLVNNFWLLGIEYFDKTINSDIDCNGKKTKETKRGRYAADFIIEKLNGVKDRCLIIELEEANDNLFTKEGISYDIFDGIKQAVVYSIKEELHGKFSKGIAVVGSIKGMNLSKKQRKELELLRNHLHKIEIWTYEDIINKAETSLKFFEKHILEKGNNLQFG
ncbi:MAG: DUF4263 domain-containing protein, partial [Candidatus Aenigmarchaeota archaeon]|nr:DUF4263 domain-containing protein [Candidatus Aenigmarchaeota archaeon]